MSTKETARQVDARAGGGRLVRRTFVIALVLVSGGLLASGAVELYLRYHESVESIRMLQREMAKGAAFKIHQFVHEIEHTMRASTLTSDIVGAGLTDSFEFQLIKLLKVTPAITTVAALDADGRERFKVSRVEMVQPEDLTNRATDEAFLRAREGASFFGPVYFVHESEPYARIAVPIKRFTKVIGVLIAEVNLKHIWDVVSRIQAGQSGYAYVVSDGGDLIAHPDISLVLKGRNLEALAQVQAAMAGAPGPSTAQSNYAGESVFAAYAVIPDLGWIVFVERPAAEVLAPLYSSLYRTGTLLLVGLAIAVLASLLIGFRVVRPLQSLRQGAARIGAGELDHRIDIQTGDELEGLAGEFNEMTAKLRESYANIERVSQLKRFFSPQLAEHIVSSGEESLTESHRQEITVVFCDLRNFTAFSSIAEPEEAMLVLQEYYKALGSLLRRFEATIEHFAGDGLMAFFNDPVPCPDPEARAVRMAVLMQKDVGELIEAWDRRGIKLGFGVGISSGYATLGHIGSEEQFHYAAIGSVANLASRLCDEAHSGQILISEAVYAAVEEIAEVEPVGALSLKGFPKPVPVLQVVRLKEGAPAEAPNAIHQADES
jgi:class 3 adenylate cyclase